MFELGVVVSVVLGEALVLFFFSTSVNPSSSMVGGGRFLEVEEEVVEVEAVVEVEEEGWLEDEVDEVVKEEVEAGGVEEA